MTDGTKAILFSLQDAHFFNSVGKPLPDSSGFFVGSWVEAVSRFTSRRREDLWHDHHNRLSEAVAVCAQTRFDETWNENVSTIKDALLPIIKDSLEPVARTFNLPKAFVSGVRWSWMNACLEAEYRDLVQPAFYTEQWGWYLKGRFPCDYVGTYPHGNFVIF